jgi:hypothetical protein
MEKGNSKHANTTRKKVIKTQQNTSSVIKDTSGELLTAPLF